MIKAKLDHKKDICEIETRGTFADVTNEVANIYEALDEPFKTLYKAALIKAIEEGELLG